MATSQRDYYDVLGLSRSASADDIKKAFRRLARQYHPDLHTGSRKSEMEKKFKELNEAQEVLSDPDKRKKYDQYGQNWEQAEAYEKARQQAGPQPGGAGSSFGGAVTSTTFSTRFSEDAVEEAVALKNSPYKEKTWRLKSSSLSPRCSAASPGVWNSLSGCHAKGAAAPVSYGAARAWCAGVRVSSWRNAPLRSAFLRACRKGRGCAWRVRVNVVSTAENRAICISKFISRAMEYFGCTERISASPFRSGHGKQRSELTSWRRR